MRAALADTPDVVVQRYVERPYLVDGRKGHVRLHGLVTSLDPFRAYLHAEGIVRFAPEPYDLSDAGLADVHAHITNTALHKDHPKLVVSQKAEEENVGAVWSLTAYLERLKADGVDVAALREELRRWRAASCAWCTPRACSARRPNFRAAPSRSSCSASMC